MEQPFKSKRRNSVTAPSQPLLLPLLPAGEHLRARDGDAARDRHLEGAGGAARRQGGQDAPRQVLQALQVGGGRTGWQDWDGKRSCCGCGKAVVTLKWEVPVIQWASRLRPTAANGLGISSGTMFC